MKEIKFRAWDGKRMLKNVGVHPFISMVHEDYEPEDDGALTISTQMKSYSIMQFIGLKDKNGKEIYEGDINQHGGICKYYPESASFKWSYGKNRPTENINKWYWVVGNIHESPELIPVNE